MDREDLVSLIDERLKNSLTEYKAEIVSSMESIITKISGSSNSEQLSKISGLLNHGHTFKHKSNEEQYKYNTKISLALDEANKSLQSDKLIECRDNIAEAQKLVAHRQKIIRLADSSELGWRVVNEYESNPLASDSDDEKRIFKAEARASKKLKAEKSKKTRIGKTWPYSKRQPSVASTPAPVNTPQSVRRPGLCFDCGKPGHWKGAVECQANASQNKISINSMLVDNGLLQEKIDDVGTNEVPVSPAGRLKSKLDMWKLATDSKYIHSVIESGYRLPFIRVPESVSLKNNRSEVKDRPYVVNPLTVAYNKIGVGLKQNLKQKLDQAGIHEFQQKHVADRMASYLLQSKADSTVKKYNNSFQLFERFCEQNSLSPKPALPITVAMYLTSLLDECKSDNVISSAFYGIKWAHRINDLNDPTESNIVKQLLECAKRIRSKPVQKKDVLTTEMFQSLCSMYETCTNVIDLRDLCIIMLSFSGLLRISEATELRCNDVSFKDNYLSINVRKSKTDIYRDGSEIVIAQGSSSACPVGLLKRYVDVAKVSLQSDEYLFKPGFSSKNKVSLIKKNKRLSYTRAKECIVKKLKLVAPNLNLGTHSLRASGVTAVAGTSNVSERCLKRHGRWKTDVAKDGYVKDSLEKRLSVTKSLHL